MYLDLSLLLPVLALGGVYGVVLRPWQLRWGARADEVARTMPGDDVVAAPSFNATRAVTIRARPEHIYPWIVQMGLNRGGWYSYDLLDNLGRKSAEVILPQLQSVGRGDLIPMSPDGKHGIYVKEFRANEWMLWWDRKGDVSWVWGLFPEGDGSCRLVTRVRMKYRWSLLQAGFNVLVEFTDIIMMRKCLSGIRERAEHLARQ